LVSFVFQLNTQHTPYAYAQSFLNVQRHMAYFTHLIARPTLSLFARPMERAVTHLCIYVLLCVYIWMHTQTHTRVFRNPYVYVCVWVIECEGVCGGASERERVGMPLGERGVVATGAIF